MGFWEADMDGLWRTVVTAVPSCLLELVLQISNIQESAKQGLHLLGETYYECIMKDSWILQTGYIYIYIYIWQSS